MKYYFRRFLGLARSFATPRGLAVALATAAGISSLFVEDFASRILIALGVFALASASLLGIRRQSDQHRSIEGLRQSFVDVEARMLRSIEVGANAPTRSSQRYDPAAAARLQEAMATVGTIRAKLGLELAVEQLPRPSEAAAKYRGTGDPSPAITIVVPIYNEEQFIGEALRSIINQTFTDWECIVVDDASTDGSLAETWRYAETDDRITIIRHKVNSGLPASRNTGLRAAGGRYIAFLDSDDLLLADNLLERIEALSGAGVEVAGSYCGVIISHEDVRLDSLPAHNPWDQQSVIDFLSAAGECPFNAHAPLLRTDVVKAHGGFDESMTNGAEDWDLWLRILRNGYVFVPSKHRTAIYRQKRASMAKTLAVEHVRESRRLIEAGYAPAPATPAQSVSHPFPEPLPIYQKSLINSRRSIQFAATALVRGDVDTAREILSGLPEGFWPVLERHLDIDLLFTFGFRRAYGFTRNEVKAIGSELDPVRSIFRNLVQEASSGSAPDLEHADRVRFDVLFLPQNAVQVKQMVEVASAIGASLSSAIVSTERVSGAQGVDLFLTEAGVPSISLDRWALNGNEHGAVVVAFPFDAAVQEIIDRTTAAGGPVFHIRTAGEDILRCRDAADAPPNQHSVASLANALTESELGSSTRLADPRAPGPLLWIRNDDDPDAVFAIEEYPHTHFDTDDLRRFHRIHDGDRCVVIGNGPSLNKLDLTKLAGEYTIGVNGIFYAADSMGYDLTYYVVEDTMVVRDNLDVIRSYQVGHRFFPSIYRDQIGEAPNTSYFMMNRGFYATTSPAYCVPRFSTDPGQRLYSGQSVTLINLQLAYYMGFKEIVLIGMDFSYTIPDDATIDGNHITSMGDDPNHFHPDYFGKGKVWKDPKLDRVLANYQLAKLMYEADGRRVVNATPGGNLELFDRVNYDKLFP